jgi:predicted DNA-binding transcriptional regulator AlpA
MTSHPANVQPDEPLHDIEWLSAYLDIPLKTLYNWRFRGVGPPAFKIGNSLRWRKSEVDQWLTEQRS